MLDTVPADKTHRCHAVTEQVRADLKHAALAHLSSGFFTANAAWLVLAVIAFDLTRAAASRTDPDLARATTALPGRPQGGRRADPFNLVYRGGGPLDSRTRSVVWRRCWCTLDNPAPVISSTR